MSEKKPPRDPAQRTNAPKALGLALGRLTRPIMKQRGVALAEIINHWAEIAGPLLTKETQPEKMVYASGAGHAATLEIGVSPAFALELQHLSPLIIDKINGYFGFRAVEKLRLKQTPIRRPESVKPAERIRRPLSADERAKLEDLLAGVDDRELRQALENLGQSLFSASR
ncbi:DciA family protein [Ferrovibrio terrae]|uniref:DUF721 domain-containing protein n=1 Tax=Ferrovibrio terrae TaxID=2594003 RepID=UPI003137D5CC